MDEKTLRTFGIAIGGGAMALAVGVAAMSGAGSKPTPAPFSVAAAPSVATPTSAETAAVPASATPASAQGASARFIVSFKPTHPLGKAQALAARGKLKSARTAAIAALKSSEVLSSLCFERFTLGGAEMVLRPCADAPAAEQTPARWLAQLRAASFVNYADANVNVDVEKKP